MNLKKNNGVELKVDFCSHAAAKYACEHWHYSESTPAGKLIKIGVWEQNDFVGCVIFGRGANRHIGSPFGLKQTQVCELVRVAMRSHKTFVSKVMSLSIKKMKKANPKMLLIVSFADSEQGHYGGIYQANNWIYIGSKRYHKYEVNGVRIHPKTLHSRYGTGGQSVEWLKQNVDKNAKKITTGLKHKYIYPLDKKTRRQIEHLALPYPKKFADD